jgi:Mg/Co/Ni transporter MgtE
MHVRPRLLTAMLLSSSHVERRATRSSRSARAMVNMGSEAERLLFVEDDGERGAYSALEAENSELRSRLGELEAMLERTEGLCEVLDDIDTETSFWPGFRARASWLVGLLVLQSLSSFILAGEQSLLSAHPVVVYFLTMLVGAGGNAGNQSAVRVIRGLAVGAVNDETVGKFLKREAYMAVAITATLVFVGGVRVVLFHGSGIDAAVITLALAVIVSTSILLGATLPLLLHRLKIDAAHAGTSIQVLMDIIGVTVTCYVANAILGASPAI